MGQPSRSLVRFQEMVSAQHELKSLRALLKADAAPDARRAEDAESLLLTVAGEIIPRLLLAHQDDTTTPSVKRRGLESQDHEHFLEHVMHGTVESTLDFVSRLLLRDIPVETVLLDLLGDAARRLGVYWVEDRLSFAEVTIGLCRLHEVLRAISVIEDPEYAGAPDGAPSILLTTACADQHIFGMVVAAEFFRRDGWRVCSEPGAARSHVAAVLSHDRFDLLGLSAACTANPDDVSNEIETYRKASRNSELRIIVGGRLFADAPELVAEVGADGTAPDAQSAPTTGTRLIADRR